MAETAIAVQTIPVGTLLLEDVTFSAGDAANNHVFENTGREEVWMKSTNGSLPAIVTSIVDVHNRTGDITLNPAAGEQSVAGPFLPAIFNQRAAANLGKIIMTIADATNVSFAVVRRG